MEFCYMNFNFAVRDKKNYLYELKRKNEKRDILLCIIKYI